LHEPSDSGFCHNCGIRLNGPYCSACGQRALPLDLTFPEYFHEFSHELVHYDGRIFQTIRRLLLWPGFLTREYLQGHRARWIPPLRLYLTLSVIFFALSAFSPLQTATTRGRAEDGWHFSWRTGPQVDVTGAGDEDAEEAARKLGFENAAAMNDTVNHAVWAWLPRLMFLLVPLFAWLATRAYRRVDRNYLHHLIFALHVHSAFFAVGALATAATIVSRPAGRLLWSVIVVYITAYLVLAFRNVYGKVRYGYVRMVFVFSIYFMAVIAAFAMIVVPVMLPRILSGNLK
jgi:hypothetical protein